jgi:UPF0755 protein
MNIILDYKKKLIYSAIIVAVLILGYFLFFSAPQRGANIETFSVSPQSSIGQVANKLKSAGFIKSNLAFDFVFLGISKTREVSPGGYQISKSMNVFEITQILSSPPYLKWIVISEGLRKEEIAAILQKNLNWSDDQKNEWINVDTNQSTDYFEGVYFPDTYLIPVDESPANVAQRLISKFEEEFDPYAKQATAQNIKWTTAIKIASIIQREAAGKSDASLISGVIWNRLLQGMKLGMDATVQYARGDTGNGWWAPVTVADLKIDSPYNTYKYSGLPPHPISNPGIVAINASINPQKTDCLYYLHDSSGEIHCSATYQGHLKNIQTYLK